MTGLTLSEKIIKKHLVNGKMDPGEEITINLDQVLMQDATGTMAWQGFEQMDVRRVKPSLCTQYIDHNLLQEDNKNMDDHLFLMTVASKFGAQCSLPGNGISHHVHKERFTRPGQTLIGSDSHTPTSGGSAMLAIGVGGLEVATGMASGEFSFTMPKIVGVRLTKKLKPWSTAKDIILELLRQVNVDGGKGKIFEFFGSGVKTLDVSQRSTIGNMGAETGATTTIFPSDALTKNWFSSQKRVSDYIELGADPNAKYADTLEIDLSEIEPLIACPYSPGKVKTVREVAGIPVGQAMIGSSTNSSYQEVMIAGKMLQKLGRNMQTSFHFLPGSRQLLQTIERDKGLGLFLNAGARITEPSCNACIGMGNAPAWKIASVRSFPRNWEGRSGTEEDQVFLSSVEVATAAAIKGELIDPRDLKMAYPKVKEPTTYVIDDKMILQPKFHDVVRKGPNIKDLVTRTKIENRLKATIIIKVGDDISTDHIMPAGAKVLPYRSNIPAIAEFVFMNVDKDFVSRCKSRGGGFIVGGKNYGQGSSREHAAIAPMFLGIWAVLAKSFARIHRSNLINFGILPLVFENPQDYDTLKQDHMLEFKDIKHCIENDLPIIVFNKSTGKKIACHLDCQPREKAILLMGGLLNYYKTMAK